MSDLPPPTPAATLILLREGESAPQFLMMERAATMVFAAGALVFPGGRIDPQDHALAEGLDAGHAAARIAAIRETIEETGVAPALLPSPSPETAASLRAGLLEGRDFPALLEEHGLTLDLEALMPFARWCPNFRETRRFDALFFLAAAPDGHRPSADQAECVRAFFAPAAETLAEIARGEAHAIFPTRRNLERLARFASLAEAKADAARYPVRTITPWIEDRSGKPHLCIPEDAGYPVTSEPLESARRS